MATLGLASPAFLPDKNPEQRAVYQVCPNMPDLLRALILGRDLEPLVVPRPSALHARFLSGIKRNSFLSAASPC